jgi:hypothetical protein
MNKDLYETMLRIVGARKASMPKWVYERFRTSLRLTRHIKCFRIPNEGLVIWLEVWCDSEEVITNKHSATLEVVARGFRGRYLPTCLSLRWHGQRRPLLLTPIESTVNLLRMEQALSDANFTRNPGPNEEET